MGANLTQTARFTICIVGVIHFLCSIMAFDVISLWESCSTQPTPIGELGKASQVKTSQTTIKNVERMLNDTHADKTTSSKMQVLDSTIQGQRLQKFLAPPLKSFIWEKMSAALKSFPELGRL